MGYRSHSSQHRQSCSRLLQGNMWINLVFVLCGAAYINAGLLGAGTGHGSCAAFPFRTDDIDHVGGSPRYAECCTELGYCHGRESWEAGYFRDCNRKSNGQPLPGTVIRLEGAEAAKGEDRVTAQVLGISQELWQSQVQKAVTFLSSSSSSSSSTSSEQSSFTGSSLSTSTGSFSSSDLIQQILLAIQPQVAQAVQSVISSQSTVSSGATSNAVNNQESFQSFTGNSQFGSVDSTQFGSSDSTQFGTSAGSNRFESSDSSQFGSSGSSQFGSSGSSQFGSSGSTGSQGNTFSTQGSQSLTGSSTLDVSELVALVVSQLTPQIAAAVQSAST